MIIACALAPFAGSQAKTIMLASLAVFCICMAAYIAAWFPLLNGVVPKDKTGTFFGKLRFTWQSVSAIFFLLCGIIIGRDADLWMLQIIIAICGIFLLGRVWYISKIPDISNETSEGTLKELLSDTLSNKPLVGFSIYLFCLYCSANATMPVVFIFAKKSLQLADNIVVILSAIMLGGLITGFLISAKIVDKYGVKIIFLAAHIGFAILNFTLFAFAHSSDNATIAILGIVVALYGILVACASVAVSSEMYALSPENNKSVSIAFCFSLYSAGLGGSRFLASLILGSGILAENWTLKSIEMTKYHSMFLIYGCAVFATCILMVLVPALTRGTKRLPSV
jgi:MFS family permease